MHLMNHIFSKGVMAGVKRGGWIHYLITKIKRGAYSIEYSFPNLLHLCIILVALLLKQN